MCVHISNMYIYFHLFICLCVFICSFVHMYVYILAICIYVCSYFKYVHIFSFVHLDRKPLLCIIYIDDDGLWGLWLWWFAWTIVVMIYMDYGCEFLFLWIWTSILCMCKCYIIVWYIPSVMIFTKLRWNAAKIFNFPKSYGVYRLKTTVTGR